MRERKNDERDRNPTKWKNPTKNPTKIQQKNPTVGFLEKPNTQQGLRCWVADPRFPLVPPIYTPYLDSYLNY